MARTAPTPSTCSRCGADFRCGMVFNDNACWCQAKPHVIPVPLINQSNNLNLNPIAQASCFCPDCLQQLMDTHDLHPAVD